MPRIPDMLLDCVVYLYPDADSACRGERTGGAGFLLDFYMPPPINKTAYYVVTSKHVAIRDCNAVRLNTHSGEVVIVELDRFHWTHHDDGDDLSICPIFGLRDDRHKFRSLSVEMLISKEKIASLDIGIGDEVFTVGRVTGAEGRLRNLPTARFGNIAQMPIEPFPQENGHWQESFLIEARSISGFSGSPVFLQILAGTPRFSQTPIPPSEQGVLLLGVNWGHLHDKERVLNQAGEVLDDGSFIKASVGMMMVVPAWKLAELIHSPRSAEIRNEILTAMRQALPSNGEKPP